MSAAAPSVFDAERIRRVRRRLHLSQQELAERFNISVATVGHWERGICRPGGAARRLLEIAEQHPELFAAASSD